MYLFAKFNISFFVFLVKLTKFINFIPKIHELILVRFPLKFSSPSLSYSFFPDLWQQKRSPRTDLIRT